MFKIEKYLLDHEFKKEKEYASGVVVYTNKDVDPEYEVTVSLFTKHNPICWEVYFNNPYGVHLMSYKDSDASQKAENIRAFTEDLIRSAFYFEKRLKGIENPWEEIVDE